MPGFLIRVLITMLGKFVMSGFWAVVFGSIIVGLTSTVTSWYIGPKGRLSFLLFVKTVRDRSP